MTDLLVNHKSVILQVNSGDQSVTGVGFSGKAFIIYGSPTSGNNRTFDQNDMKFCFGFAESMSNPPNITQRGFGMTDSNGVGTSTCTSEQATSGCIQIAIHVVTNPVRRKSAITVVNSDGYTIRTYNGGAGADGPQSGYIEIDALGGTDLVNAKVGHFRALSGHGSQTFSGVGFSGNIIIFGRTQGTSFDTTGGVNHGHLMIGMAASSTQEGATTILVENASANADTWRWQRTDRCILMMSSSGSATTQAEFTAFTNDGATLNWISGTGTLGAQDVSYLVMKISGNVHVGNFQATSGAVSYTTSGVGFSGKYLSLFSYGTNARGVATTSSHARLSMGSAVSSTSRGASWGGSEDGPTTMACTCTTDDTACIAMMDEAATPSNAVVRVDSDFTEFTSDGFTLNNTTGALSGEFSGMNVLRLVIGDITAAAAAAAETIQPKAFVSSPVPQDIRWGFGEGGFQPGNLPPVFGRPLIEIMNMNVSGNLL